MGGTVAMVATFVKTFLIFLLGAAGLSSGFSLILILKYLRVWKKRDDRVFLFRIISRIGFVLIATSLAVLTYKARRRDISLTVESWIILIGFFIEVVGLAGILYWLGRDKKEEEVNI